MHGYPSTARSFGSQNKIDYFKTVIKQTNIKNSWAKYANCGIVGNMTFRDMTYKPMPNIQSKVVPIKTRAIWVRKSDLRPQANIFSNPLDDSGSSGGVDLTF